MFKISDLNTAKPSRGRFYRWVFVVILGLGAHSLAGDWPMARHDVRRSAITDEKLSFPLQPAWEYRCAQPPAPAWPQPPRLPNKMDFDYAPHPVVAGGMVFFGSSADDTVRALDLATGQEKWHFIAGGPIRFAPQVVDNKLCFAADDGFVYCLDADTGKPIWMFKAAPADEQFIGNRRMISRWPIRTGVLVADGVLYCVAGVWPAEGICVYALDFQTGKVVWCNDTDAMQPLRAGSPWVPKDPHGGEFAMHGPTPQGALLLTRDTLIVPLANNSPAAYSRQTGNMVRYTASGAGSTWMTINGDVAYNFIGYRSGREILGGAVGDKGVKSRAVRFPPEQIPQFSPLAGRLPFQRHESGQLSAIIRDGKLYARKAFGMAMTGQTLVLGLDGAVAAVDAGTDKELWRAPVSGEAREIAIADGRVIVSTRAGGITCFASNLADKPPVVHDFAATIRTAPTAPPEVATAQAIQQLKDAGMDTGFALVIGDSDGKVAMALATQTQLNVVSVLPGPAAEALRERLLATTTLYGSRIHVQTADRLDHLPFARYFANAIIVTGGDGLSGKELYRLLRPCGGILLSPGLSASAAEALVKSAGAQEGESRNLAGRAAIVRGRLTGARDWDTHVTGDKLVRWPLRPIWFGGPDPSLVMNVGIGAHPPVAADGRYFVTGNDCLTAVDAYNGTMLWSRPIPTAAPITRRLRDLYYPIADGIKTDTMTQWGPIKRWLDSDGRHVYLRLGQNYFQDKSEALIQIDARTGRQEKFCGPFLAGARVSIEQPQSWPLAIDEKHSGTLTLQKDNEGLVLKLTAKDPVASAADAWDLFFDFRPPESRYGLYDRGTFMLTVFPQRDDKNPAAWVPGTGVAHPQIEVAGTRDAGGTVTTVRLPWSQIGQLTGTDSGRPATFAFAATLNSHDGGETEPIVQRHLFGDALAPSLNSGWAIVALGDSPASETAPPAVITGAFDPPPQGWKLPKPFDYDYIYDPGKLDPSVMTSLRLHPLTGEAESLTYRSGTAGCGMTVFSATTAIGRTGKATLGFYDFVEDGGLHFFPGIPVNCGSRMKGVNITAALGILIFSESRSHCECMIPIRTSIAFAPAERRLNEDWAAFSGHNADAPVRQVALNFGAVGDRRDEDGTLWLNFPRAVGGKAYPLEPGSRRYKMDAPPINGVMQAPLAVEFFFKASGAYRVTYRVNADRVAIAGTSRPWLYTSGYRGFKKATLTLAPAKPLMSSPIEGEVKVDGQLDEAIWKGESQTTLNFTKAEMLLRHDAKNLYLAMRRPTVIDRLGNPIVWSKPAATEDAPVWRDDSLEIFLSDAAGAKVMHLGVAASGARYDALAEGAGPENARWNAAWQSAVSATNSGLTMEVAIPWSTLTAAGLSREQLAINFQVNQKDVSTESPYYPGYEMRSGKHTDALAEPLVSLGAQGRSRCGNFVALESGKAPTSTPRSCTVRLHFAELDDIKPGQRVFDVKLQDQVVLKGLDIVKEAGGVRTALVKEFKNVRAAEALTVEFLAPVKDLTPATAPILSALEVFDEDFKTTSKPRPPQ